MEIWCPNIHYASKLSELLKIEGFEPETNGRRIRVLISAFSLRAELLLPYEEYLSVTQITQQSFEFDFPREAGVYKYKSATITAEERYSGIIQDGEYVCCQFFQGIANSLKDLKDLYFAIKAGEILAEKNWDLDHDSSLKRKLIHEAEKELNKDMQNEEEP